MRIRWVVRHNDARRAVKFGAMRSIDALPRVADMAMRYIAELTRGAAQHSGSIGDLTGSNKVDAALRLAGQVVWKDERFDAHQRPDSSRPQAAWSRV